MSQLLEPGTVLAERYRIIRLIGSGGMGAVFEAENVVTHKRVAVKWLQPLVAERPEAAARLVREAQAASRIRHPNVVDVYDVVRDGETLFLVLELLVGEPLEHVFERESLPLHELMRVLAEAMRGVAAAHKQGVIHRDLHPGNIFVMRLPDNDRCTAKVLDFGISKFAEHAGTDITQPGITLGTPLYMSFEQLRGEPNLDARADVYSFGVIVYEALTGRLPFEAGSLPELAIKFATSVPTPARNLRPIVPETLDRVLNTALSRDREQRLPNMEALIREVEAFAAVLEARPRSAEDLLGINDEPHAPHQISTLGRNRAEPTSPQPTQRPSASERPRVALTWTLTLVSAFAAAVLSAWLVMSMRDAEKRSAPAPQTAGMPEPSKVLPTLAPTAEPLQELVEPSDLALPSDAPAPDQAPKPPRTRREASGDERSEREARSERSERPSRPRPKERPAEPANEEGVFRAGRPPSVEDF